VFISPHGLQGSKLIPLHIKTNENPKSEGILKINFYPLLGMGLRGMESGQIDLKAGKGAKHNSPVATPLLREHIEEI
jgi:hypothetical protein